MKKKWNHGWIIAGVFLLLCSVGIGEKFVFTSTGNWDDSKGWEGRRIPVDGLTNSFVRIKSNATATLTDSAAVQEVRIGIEGSYGRLVLDGQDASLSVVKIGTGRVDKNQTRVANGMLEVMNGATLSAENYIAVGYHGTSSSFLLHDGTVSALRLWHNAYGHEIENPGNGGKTILFGGTLTVKYLKLEGGVLDIAGGTLRVQVQQDVDTIATLIEQGRITIKGSSDVELGTDYTVDRMDGYTVIRAVFQSSLG